jgi:hypothetical protein
VYAGAPQPPQESAGADDDQQQPARRDDGIDRPEEQRRPQDRVPLGQELRYQRHEEDADLVVEQQLNSPCWKARTSPKRAAERSGASAAEGASPDSATAPDHRWAQSTCAPSSAGQAAPASPVRR